VRPFGEEVLIEFREHRTVAVGIVDLEHRPVFPRDAQAIVEGHPVDARHEQFEDAFGVQPRHRQRCPEGQVVHGNLRRMRTERADDETSPVCQQDVVWTEHGKRIAVQAAREQLEGLSGQRRARQHQSSRLSPDP
jgi:hypothetical protein